MSNNIIDAQILNQVDFLTSYANQINSFWFMLAAHEHFSPHLNDIKRSGEVNGNRTEARSQMTNTFHFAIRFEQFQPKHYEQTTKIRGELINDTLTCTCQCCRKFSIELKQLRFTSLTHFSYRHYSSSR